MTCPTITDDATPEYTPTRDDFERKLILGIHDDAWEARITAFGIHDGERGYRLVPVDQAVNPDRGEPVTVFTASGLAELERAAAEKALNKAADELRVNFSRGAAIAMHHECHKKQCRCGNPGNDEIVREVFEAAREAIRNETLAYRRNEGEK